MYCRLYKLYAMSMSEILRCRKFYYVGTIGVGGITLSELLLSELLVSEVWHGRETHSSYTLVLRPGIGFPK